jgi:hypothetical protein
VNSLPLATIYEVKIPLRKWKKSLLQRNPAQMTLAIALIIRNCWTEMLARSLGHIIILVHFRSKR